MQFKGQLLLPGESGDGLSVNLDVAEHHLAVESDGGGLGAWPLETVDVERNGAEFSLTVAGEPLRFIADDTIAFAYNGVPAIEAVSRKSRSRTGFRSVLHRIWSGPEQRDQTVGVEGTPDDDEGGEELDDLLPERPPARNPGSVDRYADPIGESNEETSFKTAREPLPAPVAVGQAFRQEETCPAIKTDGRSCESRILTSSGYCYPHDPRRAFEDGYQLAQEARTQLKRESTRKLNRIYERLDKAIRQVERGDLDPETAMAIAQLARTMCAIVEMDDPSEAATRSD